MRKIETRTHSVFPRRTVALGAAGIVALTLAVYWPALRADFLWDDDRLITANELVKTPGAWVRFWTTREAPDYFPLTSTLFALEYRLWGDRPAGYHAVNLLLHAACAVAVWCVLRRLKVPGAFVAAGLFAVHPVNVASAAWVSEGKNTLSMLLALLTVLAYLRSDNGRWTWYAAAVAAFAAALLAKTSVVMLPVVLLGVAWWKHGRITRRDARRAAPLVLLALAAGLFTVWYQAQRAAEAGMERPEGPAARVAGAAAAVWFYLAKALLPTRLSMIYPRWQIDPASVAWWLPAAGLAAAVVTLWILRRRIGRGAAFAVGVSVVTLFPVLGLFTTHFHRYSLVADHWQYVSIVAPIALVVSAGTWVVGTMRNGKPVGLVLGGIAVVGLGAMTWQRQAAFADKRAMWADVLEKNPACWIAWYGTGKDLERRGDAAGAAEAYRRCIAINGEFDQAHNNLGVILFSAGRYELAMHHFRAALLARPTNERAQENLRETQRRYRQTAMDRPSG